MISGASLAVEVDSPGPILWRVLGTRLVGEFSVPGPHFKERLRFVVAVRSRPQHRDSPIVIFQSLLGVARFEGGIAEILEGGDFFVPVARIPRDRERLVEKLAGFRAVA